MLKEDFIGRIWYPEMSKERFCKEESFWMPWNRWFIPLSVISPKLFNGELMRVWGNFVHWTRFREMFLMDLDTSKTSFKCLSPMSVSSRHLFNKLFSFFLHSMNMLKLRERFSKDMGFLMPFFKFWSPLSEMLLQLLSTQLVSWFDEF